MKKLKQSPERFFKKSCSWKFHKIHMKTPCCEFCEISNNIFLTEHLLVTVFKKTFSPKTKQKDHSKTQLGEKNFPFHNVFYHFVFRFSPCMSGGVCPIK